MSDEKNNVIQVKLQGVQVSIDAAPPMRFDFEQHVLAGGALDPKLVHAVTSLFIQPIFENVMQGDLFDIRNLYPDRLFTLAAAYNQLNRSINEGAVAKKRPLCDISDQMIKSRVNITGMMTPHEIETKFTMGMRPNAG